MQANFHKFLLGKTCENFACVYTQAVLAVLKIQIGNSLTANRTKDFISLLQIGDCREKEHEYWTPQKENN